MKEHSTRLALIRLLADGHFHSGEKLGLALGMSRAGIAKQIKIIQQWGLDLYSVQGKGYCLAAPIELLDSQRITELVNCPQLELIPVIDSTNQHLLNQIGQLPCGAVCLAEYQQAGRGRRGRQWQSPFGSNLYLSTYWRLEAGVAAAMGLSLVVGVAIAETLQQLGAPDIRVKWPNDLYYHDKKLAGILVEMTGKAGDAAHLVIGMGLNIAMPIVATTMIDQAWTNLSAACVSLPSRNVLAATLIDRIHQTLKEYEDIGLSGFVERWNKIDNFLNRPVKLLIGERVIEGIARGINEQGALLLDTNGDITAYVGGEISLRGC
ncbi:bifunctional biotin--[acetyl-CoA-carboxylase] ligase/biotin operon repressor BirA [Photobacterium carnosum]|jgi:BirA family biotin operon repressor/biotin-[acetyl-CoA-carboxylase] ligase|uniref:Bifunctional ligase/repressor BirA n=1 Tax=Photobacterium carnosum TaxID=2023717 RepID=A0A2N4UNQ2_9GAMM|nr:bifunctional biotin--[acetyl-CoA-carboxylase] ligase/biotin operon repressor BirA [Photobacterium carnosum]KAE8175516.1 biotin--[acetyl-CoA-carboxylase] ligase [Photobacterium carnosum]MCD9496825.1 bifunctional biotin--[acetyl-CoA-carboxylase] ligase/biotin operon repressor BirA [Photobacterium carnosum]MCD9500542.1 bifunctional biotin--[acetyl-CoA-carboxylase] ligase/biotin operon repressor BirA [Photobacterium carnosum]MCD9524806.1 bifunctional biotin--[acetyl-CoA-carboxylase] ligase/bioti